MGDGQNVWTVCFNELSLLLDKRPAQKGAQTSSTIRWNFIRGKVYGLNSTTKELYRSIASSPNQERTRKDSEENQTGIRRRN